ncbi:MAG: hypothetical protein ACAH17_03095 [Candidatus Paceibacterota bacterium]
MNDSVYLPANLPKSKRPPCPFYGFTSSPSVGPPTTAVYFMDNHGNACAIGCAKSNSLTPCSMEVEGKSPDWKNCQQFNKEENLPVLAQVLKLVVVFPEELKPQGVKSWAGVSAEGWFELMTR